MDETTFAFYYPSAADAIRSAWDYEWCNSNASTPPTGEYMVWRPEPNRWHFATTLPVNGWQANGHFVSLDIDAVEASIAAARTQHADQNEQPAGSQDPEH